MKILVISAHPDDETLGCGASLLKHQESGDEIHWLIVTSPHSPQWNNAVIEEKKVEVSSVKLAYNMTSLTRLDFPAAQLETVPLSNIIDGIRDCVNSIKPNQIYTVYGGDVHTDHQIVYRSTMSVLKPSCMQDFNVRKILAFETLSSTEANTPYLDTTFTPNIFNDITQFIEQKLQIMKLYKSELQEGSQPRSIDAIRALSHYRGVTIGVPYAEAFILCRELIPKQ